MDGKTLPEALAHVTVFYWPICYRNPFHPFLDQSIVNKLADWRSSFRRGCLSIFNQFCSCRKLALGVKPTEKEEVEAGGGKGGGKENGVAAMKSVQFSNGRFRTRLSLWRDAIMIRSLFEIFHTMLLYKKPEKRKKRENKRKAQVEYEMKPR